MELEKEQINEQEDYEIIGYDEKGCKKCHASLEESRAIKIKGNNYCYSCSKKTFRYTCQHCQKIFPLSNYPNYEYSWAKKKALEEKTNCEASHLINSKGKCANCNFTWETSELVKRNNDDLWCKNCNSVWPETAARIEQK